MRRISTREYWIEFATILILIRESKSVPITRQQLKFLYNRASWTSDVSATSIAKREQRLDIMLRHALGNPPGKPNALRLKLIDWNDADDTFTQGGKSDEFLSKLAVTLGVGMSGDFWPIKRWAIAEHVRLGWE